MKRLFSLLREKRGMTLIEMVVGAGLLCVVIGIFSASLRPAAEVTRRTQDLNNAQLIADDLLETVRSKIETATGYIKCYEDGQTEHILDQNGTNSGKAIEFKDSSHDDFVLLLSTDGIDVTPVSSKGTAGDKVKVESGQLAERYYNMPQNTTYSFADEDGNAIVRAATASYPKKFYMGLRADLSFSIDDSLHTVTATVAIYRQTGGNATDRTTLYTDSQVIDLRYKTPLKTDVTAKKRTAAAGE